jgi:Kef-type K+ transport system membrane component KefB
MMEPMIGFGTLAVLGLAGLAGPLVAISRHRFVPVVIGEILAGVLVGPQLLGAVDPTQPTIAFLGEVGFAMLMLTVGMHLPLRDRRLAGSLRSGAIAAAIVAILSVPAGLLAAALAGGSHAAVYAVVLASGSAAVLLPAMQEAGVTSSLALRVMTQITIADVVTIVSVPIVLQPARVGHAVLGAALVAIAAAALVAGGRVLARHDWVAAVRQRSTQRHWALDLRIALLTLFFLAWIAQQGGTSILIAGFGAGVAVAALGGPARLSTQVRGVADGFFIPLYFVVLGARLDLGGLFGNASMLALAAALAALNVIIRLLASLLVRMPPAGALAASEQLGVPAAVSSLGLADHLLSPVAATAIVASALISLAVSTIGVEKLIGADDAAGRPRTRGTARAGG